MKKALILGMSVLALTLAGQQAMAAKAKEIKIGFVTTLSGGAGVIGKDMRNSVQIALDHLGNKMGGIPVKVLFEDDHVKPEMGKQKTEKLLYKDKVDIVSGFIWGVNSFDQWGVEIGKSIASDIANGRDLSGLSPAGIAFLKKMDE